MYLWLSKSAQAPRFVALPLSAPANEARAETSTPAAPLRLIIGEIQVEFAPQTSMLVIASLLTALAHETARAGDRA